MNKIYFQAVRLPLLLSLMAALLLSGVKSAAAAGSESGLSPGKLAVLPFAKGDFTEKFRLKHLSPITCPINQVCLDLLEEVETRIFMDKLDSRLQEVMKERMAAILISKEDTKAQLDALSLDPSKDTYLSLALNLAPTVGADYVLVPILWSYSDRVGASFAAEKTASVSFGLYLISAEQKQMVWKNQFDRSQQALTDNILKAKELFQSGGKWLTAEELALAGMEDIMNRFPLPNGP